MSAMCCLPLAGMRSGESSRSDISEKDEAERVLRVSSRAIALFSWSSSDFSRVSDRGSATIADTVELPPEPERDDIFEGDSSVLAGEVGMVERLGWFSCFGGGDGGGASSAKEVKLSLWRLSNAEGEAPYCATAVNKVIISVFEILTGVKWGITHFVA